MSIVSLTKQRTLITDSFRTKSRRIVISLGSYYLVSLSFDHAVCGSSHNALWISIAFESRADGKRPHRLVCKFNFTLELHSLWPGYIRWFGNLACARHVKLRVWKGHTSLRELFEQLVEIFGLCPFFLRKIVQFAKTKKQKIVESLSVQRDN